MSWSQVSDVAAAICLLLGSALAVIAGIGALRLPDLLTRMHAATKPQVLGVLLILLGLGLRLRDPGAIGLLVLVAIFQLLTSPIAGHMVGRSGFRSGHVDKSLLVVDALSELLDDDKQRATLPDERG